MLAILMVISGACREKPQSIEPKTVRRDSSADRQNNRYAECFGTLVIPASEIVIVTPPASGVLKSFNYREGSYVQAGSTVVTIENVEFVKLQQEYLDSKSRCEYFGEELKRQGELTIENASSVKKMQQAQMDYQTGEIKLRSLERQLAILGIKADSIDADRFLSQIPITAPVSGFIDKIHVHSGGIAQGEKLFVMVRNYHPVIALNIPENYFRYLKTGQIVDYFLPGDSLTPLKASLIHVNKQIDPLNHMIKARAIPASQSGQLIPGMRVRVRIVLNRTSF